MSAKIYANDVPRGGRQMAKTVLAVNAKLDKETAMKTKQTAMNLKAGDRIVLDGRPVTLASVSEPFLHEVLGTYQVRITTTEAPGAYYRLRAEQAVEVAIQ